MLTEAVKRFGVEVEADESSALATVLGGGREKEQILDT